MWDEFEFDGRFFPLGVSYHELELSMIYELN